MRSPVRSGVGNGFMAAIGTIYLIASLTLIAYAVFQTWGAASLGDYTVLVTLAVAAAAGFWFMRAGLAAFGHDPVESLRRAHVPRLHRKAAAARM